MLRSSISYYIFILLIFVTAFQFSAWGIKHEIYTYLRITIITTISILFFFNFKKSITYYRKTPLLRIHFWGLLVFTFILLFLFPLISKMNFNPARDLAIALAVLVIGLNMDLKEKHFNRIVNIYIVLYTFAALSIVFTFSSGFIIHDQYLPVPKNQLAPAFGVAFMLSLYFGFKKKGIGKWFYYISAAILLSSLLVIRGRAVIVAVFLTMFIFIFYYIRSKKLRILTIAAILLLIQFISQFIYESLFLNYDLSDIDSISTGRMERNIAGINFFQKYPLGGQLGNPNFTEKTIHNYLLFNVVNYGILLASILFAIYFKYLFTILKAIRHNTYQYFEVGPLLFIILMVISLFEYTYPFAPGSAIFFPFFLMGQYLKHSQINE